MSVKMPDESTAEIVVGSHALAVGGFALVMFALFLSALSIGLPSIVVAPLVVAALTFLPGFLILLLVDEWQTNGRFLVYSVGISLLILIANGFVINLVFPLFGVDKPLSFVPLTASVLCMIGVLTVLVIQYSDNKSVLLSIPELSPGLLSLLLLPPLTILAVTYLNITGETLPIIMVLIILAIIPFLLINWIEPRWYGLGVWTSALSVLYHKSLWEYYGFTGSPGVILTWKAKKWNPGIQRVTSTSTDLLENGILFPAYARLSDIHIITELLVVNPFFVAFIPLAMFLTFKRYTDSTKAMLGAFVFIFAHPFYLQYPPAGRAATPVLFLALFGVVISDSNLRSPVASGLSVLFISGIIVTHYGTSYFVLVAFVGAFGVLFALQYVDTLGNNLKTISIDSILNHTKKWSNEASLNSRSRFTYTLVLFHMIGALVWYMYAAGGTHFAFPKYVITTISDLLSGQFFSGSTASRLKESNVENVAIAISKRFYLILGGLMGIGILQSYYNRFSPSGKTLIDDAYLAVSTLMLGTFGMTLMAAWGGGRPMMITFVFTTIYAVLSVHRLNHFILTRTSLSKLISVDGDRIFAIFLTAMLLLNSGVASAVALEGIAPSNVAAQEKLAESESPEFRYKVYRTIDVQAHTWLIDNADQKFPIHSGYIARGQTDWYRPSIHSTTKTAQGYRSAGFKGPQIINITPRNKLLSGYVLVLGHNTALDGIWGIRREKMEIGNGSQELISYSRIYSTKTTNIYFNSTN